MPQVPHPAPLPTPPKKKKNEEKQIMLVIWATEKIRKENQMYNVCIQQ